MNTPDTSSENPLLSGLNAAQRRAVLHAGGPLLVIAGAGSGKTRTLVHRMAHLVATGVAPESILLLTFTRKAAQNMLWRAAQLMNGDPGCRRVMGGTFHATANLLLRQYGQFLGINPHFTIIDRADSEGIINLIKSSLGKSGADKRFPTKRVIMNLISGTVNKNATLEELVMHAAAHLMEFLDDFREIADGYAAFKRDHGLMDYDDLLVNWHRLLKESTEARAALSARFQHILVDEYQDTNHIQAEIVRLLASHGNIMVVGDDAQSIYSFRGADFANIMNFERQFPGARRVLLEQNYRSTRPILDLSNEIIAHAEERFDKALFTECEGGLLPVLASCATEAAEARFVADEIAKLVAGGTPIAEIAVLFRSAFHSFKLEIELAGRSQAFEKRGGLKLTESAHIKDVLAFFRVTVNPQDELSWSRLLLQLDKVGPKTAQKIVRAITGAPEPLAALQNYPGKGVWKAQLARLTECLADLQDGDQAPAALFDVVMGYYQPVFEKLYFDDYPKRSRDLEQLKALAAGYGDLRALVDDTTLDPPESDTAGMAGVVAPDGQKLVLSTIHSAKGLEWDAVFVIGLAEGRFPGQYILPPGEQWEEERRLFYVAATRARKHLYLSYPKEMVNAGQRGYAGMSPFVAELKPMLYETATPTGSVAGSFGVSGRGPAPYSHGPGSLERARAESLASAAQDTERPATAGKVGPALSATELQPGTRVSHAFFGPGTISRLPSPGRVEVYFDRHGSKILHLDYAKLMRL